MPQSRFVSFDASHLSWMALSEAPSGRINQTMRIGRIPTTERFRGGFLWYHRVIGTLEARNIRLAVYLDPYVMFRGLFLVSIYGAILSGL
jgi:hypothetical protein